MQRLPEVFLITMVFGLFYFLIDKMNPKSFGFKTMLDPFYFSFTTMSTVGYGDFSPTSNNPVEQGFFLFGLFFGIAVFTMIQQNA